MPEFKRLLRYYGAIKVSDNGGVDTIQVEVPVENSKKYLDELYQKIMLFGQAVHFSSDKFGSAPSGVGFKLLYTNLNFESKYKFQRVKLKLLYRSYFGLCLSTSTSKENIEILNIRFNYNKVANTELQVQTAQQSMGIVSHETVLENHPFCRRFTSRTRTNEQDKIKSTKQLA